MNRRRILKIAGATVVVAGSALAWRAFDQGVFSAGSGAAYEPWRNWQADDSLRPLRLVRAAILAANPHNSQPWRFRVADNAMRIRGRLWQRMHLWATTKGLAVQPLNQMSERADREQQLGIEPRFGTALKELVADADSQALMPFRIGYPTMEGRPSPRRDLKSVLM